MSIQEETLMTELVELRNRIEKLEAILGVAIQPLSAEPYFDKHELSIAVKAFISGNTKPLDVYKRNGGIIKMI